MRSWIFAAALIFAACTGSPSSGQQSQNGEVAQGPPNSNFTPAFEGQTRAPEARSGVTIHAQEIASGLDHPWAIVFLPDGRMLITERAGRLRVVTREGRISAPIEGLPRVHAQGQGGLLDVVLSPGFAADRTIYWSYAEPRDDGRGTSVARGRLSADMTRVENVQVIFRQMPARESGGHYGSRLVFDREGRLFVTLGERQRLESRALAQDLSTTLGKVVRINADGSVPADNPFVGRADARPEIWSYGHRNVQGAALNPATGVLWTHEHGPQGGDEVNVGSAGGNYGWPAITHGREYGSGARIGEGTARADVIEAVKVWIPSIAPSGMQFYTGEALPAWRGSLFVGALSGQLLVRLALDGDRVIGEERLLEGLGIRVRDVRQGPDGFIYLLDEGRGRILRLSPAS